MCSISGIFTIGPDREGSKSVGYSSVERMNAALRHRGPDDQGIAEIAVSTASDRQCRLFLGNTRLAILDTSLAGHQPMHDLQTGNWITYNGETYNFRALRQEVGDEYGPWESHTDTEVVLRAYRKWGIESLKRLRGMFALAIWDAGKQQLILARDSFGIKPLYYASFGDSQTDTRHFLFASELRALLASNLVPAKLNGSGLTSFLNCGSIQSPLTILEGVTSLGAGESLTVGVGSVGDFELTAAKPSRNASNSAPQPRTRADAVIRLREELEESVRSHLVSDVPLGVFLSGGMDSSALVALMSRVSAEQLRTFTVVFDEKKFTESAHAGFIARSLATDHCDIPVSEEQMINLLPSAMASLDQPTMDGINTYVISRAVKNAGITVALSGLGGDELFAGYPSFARALKLRSLSSVSRSLLRAAAGIGKIALKQSVRGRKFAQLARGKLTPFEIYQISRELFSQDEIAQMMSSNVRGSSNGHQSCLQGCQAEAMSNASTSNPDWINSISEHELFGYMSNTLLRDTDSMSMASSLEVRVPFVDVNIINYVLTLPGDWKVDNSRPNLPKPLFADAVNDLLPPSFLSRPKMGFTLPFEKWIHRRLRNELDSVFEDHTQLRTAGLEPKSVSRLWRNFLRSPRSVGWSRPWSLYVLAKWCELNNVQY